MREECFDPTTPAGTALSCCRGSDGVIQFDHRGSSRGFTKLSLRSTHVASEVDDKQTSASPPGTSLHVGRAPAVFADYPRSVPGGHASEHHWGAFRTGILKGLSQRGSLRSLSPVS